MSSVLQAYLDSQEELKRFLARSFSASVDIENLAQEAFLRAYAAEARSEIRSPRAFLFQVAKNLALTEVTRNTKFTQDAPEDMDESQVAQNEGSPGVSQEHEAREKLLIFTHAVARLPPKCQRVFLLRKVTGLQVKEVARKLDITISAVEKHVAVGLLRCREYMVSRGYDPAELGDFPVVKRERRVPITGGRSMENQDD
jgi:RNA polymerase sigma-70 factor (ECF subfamily)